MKRIPLTRGKYAIVDDEDFEYLCQWRWQAWQSHSGNWYAIRSDWNKGKPVGYRMHRVIAIAERGQICDHINGNGLDNRRSNLRFATQGQNCRNRRDRGSSIKVLSRYKGVTKRLDKNYRRPCVARIYCDGKQYSLGRYDTELDAAIVYDVAAQLFHGEYACLNFPLRSPKA